MLRLAEASHIVPCFHTSGNGSGSSAKSSSSPSAKSGQVPPKELEVGRLAKNKSARLLSCGVMVVSRPWQIPSDKYRAILEYMIGRGNPTSEHDACRYVPNICNTCQAYSKSTKILRKLYKVCRSLQIFALFPMSIPCLPTSPCQASLSRVWSCAGVVDVWPVAAAGQPPRPEEFSKQRRTQLLLGENLYSKSSPLY